MNLWLLLLATVTYCINLHHASGVATRSLKNEEHMKRLLAMMKHQHQVLRQQRERPFQSLSALAEAPAAPALLEVVVDEAPGAAPSGAIPPVPVEAPAQAPAQAPAEAPAEIPAEAPAEGLGPAPAPAPAEAPVAAPAQAPEVVVPPSPVANEEPILVPPKLPPSPPPKRGGTRTRTRSAPTSKPTFTKRIQNVDYAKLSADQDLKTRFEEAVKVVFAAEAGNGITPADVTLELSAGSVIIKAWIKGSGSESISREAVAKNLCSSSDVDDDLVAAVSALDGFGATTSGTLTVDSAPECAEFTPAVNAAPTTTTIAGPTTTIKPSEADSGTCDPACIPGRGICGDRVCFCKSPYAGIRCELELKEQKLKIPIEYTMTAMIMAAALGIVAAEILKRSMQDSNRTTTSFGARVVFRKDFWAPQAGGK